MKPDRALWSVVSLILVAVLVPTASILYFMNEAINNQRDIANQKLAEVYRGQLRKGLERLEAGWEARAAEIDRVYGSPEARFKRVSTELHLADAIFVLGEDGQPVYPSPPPAPQPEPRAPDSDIAGRALQAEIRSLARNDPPGALKLIERFRREPFLHSRDRQGRSIAADEALLALHLIPSADPRRLEAATSLHKSVVDYDFGMPSYQRLFLMEELRSMKLGAGTDEFPTYNAERLAAQYLESVQVRAGENSLRRSGVPDVWRLTTPGGVVALYRDDTAIAMMPLGQIVQSFELKDEANATFGISPPGRGGVHDIVLTGEHWLPGWQISLDLAKPRVPAEVANRQRAAYLWVGLLVIATLAATGLIAGQMFLRQARLTRLKTDLVATVSHELKTPLAGMRLLVDTLLDDPESDPVKTREYLQLIARENARLSRLIDNFLTFSRMERNRAQFEMTRTDAAAVVRAAVESVGERYAVEVSVAPDLPPIQADEDAIVTVLLNLLDNAYKYSVEPRHIELSAYAEDGRCCFAVTDNGIGIPARQQRKIFRRFYQVERHLTRRPGGVGLGLSIVEFIVKAHGGTVRVESRPGSGSRFAVSLPAVAA
jgi:signal transduction histidine kinase